MTSIDWSALMSLTSDDPLTPGLYICPTPIGNLEDITLRVLKALMLSDIVAAEDTRHSLKLLNHYGIRNHLISYHEHNVKKRGPELVEAIQAGKAVALVSDAGMPGISDPGADIIRLCIDQNLPVVVLPGPSASITALVASGLNTERFIFCGFPERSGKRRKELLQSMVLQEGTVIMYESPHRIAETLKELLAMNGDLPAVLGREITKRYEEYIRGTFSSILESLERKPAKGELVLLFEGKPVEHQRGVNLSERIGELTASGMGNKEIAKVLSGESGIGKNEIYQMLIGKNK